MTRSIFHRHALALLACGCLLACNFPGHAAAQEAASAKSSAQAADVLQGATILTSAVTLRDHPLVYSDTVKLGDIFDGAGDAADRVLGRAPEPGQTMVLNAQALARIAHSNNLDWRPADVTARALLVRASQHVTTQNLKDAVAKAIAEQSGEPSWAIEFDRRNVELQIPAGEKDAANATLSVDRVDFTPDDGHFYVEINAYPAPDKSPVKLSLYGRAVEEMRVPILNKQVAQQGIISANDIDWKEWPKGRLLSDTVMDEKDLIGHQAVRGLMAGQPVRREEVEAQRVVQRGDLVTMIYETPFMRVTSEGRSLADGAVGGTIRVMNTQSSRTVEGTVLASGEVSVQQTQFR